MTLSDGIYRVDPGKFPVIVTHLEMTQRPSLRGAALPSDLTFKPLDRDPVVYRDLFRRVGQDWLWSDRLTMDDLSLCTIIEDESVSIWTLEKNGVPEALLELDFRIQNACELAYFGLTPALIGTGSGAFLMDQAIKSAWDQPISKFTVHTCTLDSPQALGFYQRSGFKAVRREVEVSDDPRQSGVYSDDVAPDQPRL